VFQIAGAAVDLRPPGVPVRVNADLRGPRVRAAGVHPDGLRVAVTAWHDT
jgi:hypothetical protein